MIDKFKKNTNCAYCETEMEALYRSKRFCSDKCRVYYNRDEKKRALQCEVADTIIENKPEVKVEVRQSNPMPENLSRTEKMKWLRNN